MDFSESPSAPRRMTGAELRDFVERRMQMSANYQPVIIKNLIRAGGGRLPADTLARALMLEDPSQVARSRTILLRMPKPVLTNRGVVHYDRSTDEIELLVDFESDDEKDEVARICERKIEQWNKREAPRVRTASRDVKVFERARWRCELCGVPATVRPLQIDHIIPRSKRDRTDHVTLHGKRIHYEDSENLQSLCGPCNQGKSNTRDVDYRPSTDWIAETIAYTLRLAKFYKFDTDDVLLMANQQFAADPNLPRD
jgi:5-methylcytosine-specific restriction endonuclease McrA